MSRTRVFKFGGTSMGSIERIEHVANLCEKLRPQAVVVSAMAGETNRLVALGKGLNPRIDLPEYDMLVSSGEQVSVALLSLALRKRGLNPVPMLASHAGIETDAQFSKASIQKINGKCILDAIAKNCLPIIAGFQGVTKDGQLTSLGRGGSDTSAVAVTAAIGAQDCVIYTDVDGVYTTDPRLCPKARLVKKIHYEEMLEMASQGSKVLHIRSVHLAAKWGIKLMVKNTFAEDNEGTEVLMDNDMNKQVTDGVTYRQNIEGEIVTGVATTQDEAWIHLGPCQNPKFTLAGIFSLLAENGINVDIINQNKMDSGLQLSFTIASDESKQAVEILKEQFPDLPIKIRDDTTKISIVGVGMRTHPGVAAKMFRCLAREDIEVLLVTTSEIKVGCLILREKLKQAVNALHHEFLE